MTPAVPSPPAVADRWVESGTDVRTVLRRLASGVGVITAGTSAPVGFCATSLSTMSLDPALMAFSVGARSASWAAIRTAEHVVAHLLDDSQEDLARRFGRSGAGKFAPPTRWRRDDLGLPLLHGVLGWLVLAPLARIPVDDHILVVCRVIRAALGDSAEGPLIHHAGRFASLGPAAAAGG
jgi:flavin reductase (DIM6/NTAB) family NADH-FMN oxidoreductase RutF